MDNENQSNSPIDPTVPQPPVIPQSEFVDHWGAVGAPKPKGRVSRVRLIIGLVIIILLVIIAVVAYKFSSRKNLPIKVDNSASIVKPPPRPASSDTPLGEWASGSSDTKDISIKIGHILYSPKVTGDKPSAGDKYVEIDLSIDNRGKEQTIIPGTFVYQTTAGNLINTADTIDDGPGSPGKTVQVAGKESLEDLSLGAGQTANQVYLIYQVPSAVTAGKLIWYDGYYDNSSTKLAIFDLD